MDTETARPGEQSAALISADYSGIKEKLRNWRFWRNLFLLYLAGAWTGHLIEMLYAGLRGFLYPGWG